MTFVRAARLDLISLRWTAVVANEGGFRRAAETLGVEQSAVSRRIRSLEETLGVSLFHRDTRGVTPTNAGVTFLKAIEAALAILSGAVEDARSAGAGQRGRLRIGLTATFIADYLMRLLDRFQGAHPRVRIEVVDGTADEQLAAVADRRIDIAVLPGGMTVTGLDVSELWREPLHIALPTSHPLNSLEAIELAGLAAEHVMVSNRDLGQQVIGLLVTGDGRRIDVEAMDAGVPVLLGLTGLRRGLSVMSAGAASALRPPPDVVVRAMADAEGLAPFTAAWSHANDNPVLRRFVSTARTMSGFQ